MPRLNAEAFEYYLGLGAGRSYDAVAKHFGVSKRSVLRRSQAENWHGRIAEIEAEALESARKKQVEGLEARTERHLKILRLIEAKALETLRSLSIGSCSEATKALDLVIKHERAILGLTARPQEPPRPETRIVVMSPEEYSATKERLRSWWHSSCSERNNLTGVIDVPPASTSKPPDPEHG